MRATDTVNRVLARAAEVCGVSVADIMGPGREAQTVKARHIAMAILRDRLGYSYQRLAKMFGRSDHTTAMSAVKTIYFKRLADARVAEAYSEIESALLDWREEREIEALDMAY